MNELGTTTMPPMPSRFLGRLARDRRPPGRAAASVPGCPGISPARPVLGQQGEVVAGAGRDRRLSADRQGDGPRLHRGPLPRRAASRSPGRGRCPPAVAVDPLGCRVPGCRVCHCLSLSNAALALVALNVQGMLIPGFVALRTVAILPRPPRPLRRREAIASTDANVSPPLTSGALGEFEDTSRAKSG